MRIGFVVNSVATELPGYTTTHLAMAAREMGHEAWVMDVGDFAVDPDNHVRARAVCAPGKSYRTGEAYLEDLFGKKAGRERITVDALDVLMLRNVPAEDVEKPWAQTAGFIFAQLALRSGVIVLNDPHTLAGAINKMYFQHFPEEVRPRTLITRDAREVRRFIESEDGHAVIKPLQGSGGANVFRIRPDDTPNINQMIAAVMRDGYVIVQEYLPATKDGDTRLFLMNGRPFKVNGRYAAFRRISSNGDARSNPRVGGRIEKAVIDDAALRIAEIVRPKLVQDGMFLVGLDIAGDKLMEINVFSPGGLDSAQRLEGDTKFVHAIIEALETKVRYRDHGRGPSDNLTLATL